MVIVMVMMEVLLIMNRMVNLGLDDQHAKKIAAILKKNKDIEILM